MRRGELWTVLDSGYAAKPPPALIVQPQTPGDLESVILVMLTTFDRPETPSRVAVEPTEANGLRERSWVMADKLLTVPKSYLGTRVGAVADAELRAVSSALAAVLGIGKDDIVSLQ
ncbi:MAG: type II toxin-antitoxin system PemK/MazF family toxin [Bifidobacteriaceae bacterium]|jgi:mRNA interferase MazF|nr:type II toxin-antitoxin system PemK/MazF family toxin [Bifidobacteriaceae bacterium]